MTIIGLLIGLVSAMVLVALWRIAEGLRRDLRARDDETAKRTPGDKPVGGATLTD